VARNSGIGPSGDVGGASDEPAGPSGDAGGASGGGSSGIGSGGASGSGSAGTTNAAGVSRSSQRKPAGQSESPVVDLSGDAVIDAADPKSTTAPVAELHALDQEHLQKLAAAQRSRVIKAVVLAVIAVLFIIFVLQNAQPVNVRLVFGTVTVRMIWVIVASGGLGALAGFLLARPDQNIHFHLPERRGKGKAAPKGKPTKPEAS
jgi:uncharacterized integral membrane protein